MGEYDQITRTIHQIANVARADTAVAAAVRQAILDSGLFEVFGVSESLEVVDIYAAGGEAALRARLGPLSVGELRAIIQANNFDQQRETSRWRSPARFIELIVARAQAQFESEQKTGAPTKALAEASWML
jgi:hypothetical protein